MIQQFLFWVFTQRIMKTVTWKDTCTPIFIAAFTITKILKKPKCSLIDKWLEKIWYIYNGILLNCRKRNELLLVVITQIGSRGYYAKWSESEKDKYFMILLAEFKKQSEQNRMNRLIDTEKQKGGTQKGVGVEAEIGEGVTNLQLHKMS